MAIPGLISVVIPTYNRAHLLTCAARSVLAQTYAHLEVLIVDDYSQDNTNRVVDELGDSRINYVRHDENRGGSAARNTGIRAARGEYIAFLDSDDVWRHDKLQKQIDVLRSADENTGAVYSAFVVVDDKQQVRSRFEPQHKGDLLSLLVRRNCIGTTSTVLVRRSCFEKVGTFDENLRSCQDWDMWIRIAKCYRFDYAPETLVMYAANSEPNRISANVSAILDGHDALFKKHTAEMAQMSDSERADLLVYLGKTVALAGAPEQGKSLFKQAIGLDPTSVRAYAFYLSTVAGPRGFNALRTVYARMKSASKRKDLDLSPFRA